MDLKKILKQKINFKLAFFTGLASSFYLLFFYGLFVLHNIFGSLIFVFLFFISFHFFYLEYKKYSLNYMLIGLIIASIVEIILIGFNIRQLLLAILVFNAGVYLLASSIEVPLKYRTKFRSLTYFTTGGFIFTVFIAIAYSLALSGMFKKFPFTCIDLSNASSTAVDFFTKPLELGLDKANKIKESSSSFFSSQIKDIISENKITIEDSENIINSNQGMFNKIDIYKEILIDRLLEDKSSINMGICDYLLGEITERFNKPSFQVSLIMLMYLLLYGFLRIIFLIISFVGFIIFRILYLLKVYKIKKINIEIDDI